MEIKIRGGEIILTHTLKNNETYKVSRGSKFQSIHIYKKPKIVSGISNITEDNFGVLFCDYDSCDKEIVIEDYQLISKIYKLPPAYLFQSSVGGWHVICLSKFPHRKIYEIMQYLRVDENYKNMPLRNFYRSYILRISPKGKKKRPRFIGIVGEVKNLDKEVSSAHLNLLNKIYKLPKIEYSNQDNLKGIKLQEYES